MSHAESSRRGGASAATWPLRGAGDLGWTLHLGLPVSPGSSGLRYLTPSQVAGTESTQASSLAIDREAVWRADHVAVEGLRDVRGDAARLARLAEEAPDRNWLGSIVANGSAIVSDPSLAVVEIVVNARRRVLVVAEETEHEELAYLRDANPVEWSVRGGGQNRTFPIWIGRDDLPATRVQASGEIKCMDVSADGSTVAVLEWGSHPVLAKIDIAAARRSMLREFPDCRFTAQSPRLAGNERIMFSPGRAMDTRRWRSGRRACRV